MIWRAMSAAALLTGTLATGSAAAQAIDSTSRVRFAGACSSGLPGGGPTCPFERRLVVELETEGAGAPPELRPVIRC